MGGVWEMNAWSLIKAGGPVMVPIILCSIFALGIVIEKLLYYAFIKTNVPRLKKQVFDYIKNNRIKESIETGRSSWRWSGERRSH